MDASYKISSDLHAHTNKHNKLVFFLRIHCGTDGQRPGPCGPSQILAQAEDAGTLASLRLQGPGEGVEDITGSGGLGWECSRRWREAGLFKPRLRAGRLATPVACPVNCLQHG